MSSTRWKIVLLAILCGFGCIVMSKEKFQHDKKMRSAVITLLMDTSSGFVSGCVTLAQSLIDSKSQLERVVMVTPDVDYDTRKFLKRLFDVVVEVPRIDCIFKTSPIADKMFDMGGPIWASATKNWRPTCTKLAVWNQTNYDRVIFMDSDMLAVGLVDDALLIQPDLPFLAAPEILPPDTINSGFMVLEPSASTFEYLLSLNADMGVAWTGDQYLINHGLCPAWHSGVNSDSAQIQGSAFLCGRLPWIYNTQINNYHSYSVVASITAKPQPRVIHFISDGKPWLVLGSEFQDPNYALKLKESQIEFGHAIWRRSYYKAMSRFITPNDVMTYALRSAKRLLSGDGAPGFLVIQGLLGPDDDVKEVDSSPTWPLNSGPEIQSENADKDKKEKKKGKKKRKKHKKNTNEL